MNPDLKKLQPYPFEKLAQLKTGITPARQGHIALSIGEPKHPAPEKVLQSIRDNLDRTSRYPLTRGMDELRNAIADWLQNRYRLADGSLDANRHVVPVNGTREALFAIAQCLVDRTANRDGAPLVLMPNPFYQIYEGAALLAGAEAFFYATDEANDYLPDFTAIEASVWRRCQLIYLCSPGNPTGRVIPEATLKKLIGLAREHDFVIVSDECYSEIYFDEQQPPPGLLQAAHAIEAGNFSHCLVFHSLSKRSNLPGLRSGFVAGDADLIDAFLLYRTYHGCAMPPVHQLASITAWRDEQHVIDNRRRYREKFTAAIEILAPHCEVKWPDAGFYLWLKTPLDDIHFARELYASQNVTVLPGQFLSRDRNGTGPGDNPGRRHVRIALVAPLDECVTAAERIKHYLQSLA